MTPSQVNQIREEYLLPYPGRTREGYARSLDLWFAWCVEESIDPLAASRADINRYIRHLINRGGMPASVRYRLAPVRGFYRFSYLEHHLPRDPAALARLPRVSMTPNTARCLDRPEMRALLAFAEQRGGTHQAAAYLLGYLGLRCSEACSLRIEDMAETMRGKRVLQFIGKGNKPARIPLPPPIVLGLEQACHPRTDGPLLVDPKGRALTRRSLLPLVARLGLDAGITCPVHPRLLRASCLTNALDSGAPLSRVQELARHELPQTTMRYDRNRTNLDDHAVHSLVSYLIPRDEDESRGEV